ncbi:MAG: DUF2147 domain-containing protein [Bacteroidota bacterium]
MRRLLALLVLAPLFVASALAQSLPPEAEGYLGDWTIVDDESGESQAVVRITDAGDGTLEGRIVRVLPTSEYPVPQFQCDDCRGDYAGADLREIRLIYDMEWNGERFGGGRIVDPLGGRTYRAVMNLDGADRLRVRGYVGIRAFGRTQVWQRTR